MELVLLVCEPESVVVLKVRHLRSATVRRGFHGLLLGQNATRYGLHVDGVILRITRDFLAFVDTGHILPQCAFCR